MNKPRISSGTLEQACELMFLYKIEILVKDRNFGERTKEYVALLYFRRK